MINLDLIKQFADLKNQLAQDGVYGFFQDGVQVSAKELMKLPNVEVESFNDDMYPYCAFVIINGLKLFGLLSRQEMNDYGYMVEDVNLSGNMEKESGDRIA
jgi:capsule polysaccharide export protein KpsE/RkpR